MGLLPSSCTPKSQRQTRALEAAALGQGLLGLEGWERFGLCYQTQQEIKQSSGHILLHLVYRVSSLGTPKQQRSSRTWCLEQGTDTWLGVSAPSLALLITLPLISCPPCSSPSSPSSSSTTPHQHRSFPVDFPAMPNSIIRNDFPPGGSLFLSSNL